MPRSDGGSIADRIEEYRRRYDSEPRPEERFAPDVIIFDPCWDRRPLTDEELRVMEREYKRVFAEDSPWIGCDASERLERLCRLGNRYALRNRARHHITYGEYSEAGWCLVEAISGGDTESALMFLSDIRVQKMYRENEEMDLIMQAAMDTCEGFLDRAFEQASHDKTTVDTMAYCFGRMKG